MKQKQLYRTLETVASKKFANEKELLIEILEQIVSDINIDVTGGRLWKLDPAQKGYRLLHQTGNVPKINPDFILPLSENPIFEIISFDRTVLADETNKYLIKKGIFKYSASGVGSKIKIDGKRYYEYMLAVNSTEVDDDLRNNLNVIATLLTSKIRERRVADSREELMSDLDEAKKLQRSILPDHEHHFNNYDIFGITVPAKIMSGDYFDYLEYGSDEERLGVVVGDAASKGASAAAEAMYISGAIRMAMNFEIK
ncbi:MAG: serine/threonine-protein phosphatase, partial [Chlorobi bacterium]|nr:serine/threonine-protein phosphatase [Chlorobiota bacterium]